MKTTNNSVKYEVPVKQYLPAFLDISEGRRPGVNGGGRGGGDKNVD